MTASPTTAQDRRYPGERLGLPESGPGSIAGLGRRIGGLVVDWAIALGAGQLLAGGDPLATSGLFVVVTALPLLVFGSTIGHLLFGMHLRRVNGEAAGWWRPILRQALLALVIPAVVWDTDQRGGHDILAGTVLRRR